MSSGSSVSPGLPRRRLLRICAGMAALPLLTARPARPGPVAPPAAPAPPVVTWEGTALGAAASITLADADPLAMRATINRCLAEVERLEREFSLYRPDSAIARLNRDGLLDRPSLDFRLVLERAAAVAAASAGAFDVSVQPLWRLHAEHFARHPGDRAGPPAAAVAAACRLIDHRRIAVTPTQVRLGRGMAITLNGIAQGYITDRVAALLRDAGWSHVLVALGEIRALADHPDRRPWQIALPGGKTLAIADRAVATSAGAATRFEPSGHFHHLFSPDTGQSVRDLNQVTVLAADATIADALATALYVMPADRRSACLARFPGVEALLVAEDGRSQRLPPT